MTSYKYKIDKLLWKLGQDHQENKPQGLGAKYLNDKYLADLLKLMDQFADEVIGEDIDTSKGCWALGVNHDNNQRNAEKEKQRKRKDKLLKVGGNEYCTESEQAESGTSEEHIERYSEHCNASCDRDNSDPDNPYGCWHTYTDWD